MTSKPKPVVKKAKAQSPSPVRPQIKKVSPVKGAAPNYMSPLKRAPNPKIMPANKWTEAALVDSMKALAHTQSPAQAKRSRQVDKLSKSFATLSVNKVPPPAITTSMLSTKKSVTKSRPKSATSPTKKKKAKAAKITTKETVVEEAAPAIELDSQEPEIADYPGPDSAEPQNIDIVVEEPKIIKQSAPGKINIGADREVLEEMILNIKKDEGQGDIRVVKETVTRTTDVPRPSFVAFTKKSKLAKIEAMDRQFAELMDSLQ